MNHDKLIRFYETDNKYFQKITTRKAFEYRAVVSIIKKYFRSKNSRIIDIGCGPGILIKQLKDYGYKVEGIDLCKRFVNYANKKGIKVHNKDFLKAKPEKYDCIIATDFLEHATDIEEIIRKMKNMLSKNGLIIIQGPNMTPVIAFQSKKKICLFFKKYLSYLFGKKISPSYIKPVLNSKTHNMTDSDACYLINAFDIKYFFGKKDLNIQVLSTYLNPLNKYSLFKRMVVRFLSVMPVTRYMGGSLFVVASTNKYINRNLKADFNRCL